MLKPLSLLRAGNTCFHTFFPWGAVRIIYPDGPPGFLAIVKMLKWQGGKERSASPFSPYHFTVLPLYSFPLFPFISELPAPFRVLVSRRFTQKRKRIFADLFLIFNPRKSALPNPRESARNNRESARTKNPSAGTA